MHISLKHAVSAVALLAAAPLAEAQTNERQGAGKGEAQHGQIERPSNEGGAMQHQGGAAEEREKGSAPARSERPAKTGAQREDTPSETHGERHSSGKPARFEERGQANRQTERQTKGNPGVKGSGDNAGRRDERNAQSEKRQRQSNVGGAGRSEDPSPESRRLGANRPSIHISLAQKTELHNVIVRDTALRRYHRGEVNFAGNIGTRIPASVEFYDLPARFVETLPEFGSFKIVVLDDEILVIDPVTREIVDVIPM
jgi:hypothetical protein